MAIVPQARGCDSESRIMTGAIGTVASFIAETTLDTLPGHAAEKAKKAIADTFAAVLAGGGSESR